MYVRSAHSVLRVCKMRKRAAYACHTNLSIAALSAEECLRLFRTWKRAAYMGLRHARSKVSGGLRHAYATLSLLSRRVVNVVPDLATVYCGQRYDLKAKLPGGGKFWKKLKR